MSMIEIQMCTKHAIPSGALRDTDILWALGAVKADTGEDYDLHGTGAQGFVSGYITIRPFLPQLIFSSWRTSIRVFDRIHIQMPRSLSHQHMGSTP